MTGRVQGKVCVVTGASMGIGAACARRLAEQGAVVVLTDRADAQGEALATQLRAAGLRASYRSLDVTDEARWQAVIDEIVREHGRLDVLVNNAGTGVRCAPDEQTLEQWRALTSINLDGVFLGTKHAIRAMKRNDPKGGSIVNMSSIEGLIGDPMLGAYNATKGGVTLYTKSVALYCARERTGIRVNSVHPGYIATPLVQGAIDASPDPAAMRRALESLHPVGHLGEPDDIAWGVVYLASDESKFMTGASLVIDGGYTAQ